MTRSGMPIFFSTSEKAASTWAAFVASHFTANPKEEIRSGFRDATATSKPSFAKRRAREALSPLPAPTMNATAISGRHRRSRADRLARRALVHQPLQREGGDADHDQRAPGEV